MITEEFPFCCGATIVADLPQTEPGEEFWYMEDDWEEDMTEERAKEIVEKYFKGLKKQFYNGIVMAILNEYQRPAFAPILGKHGFKEQCMGYNRGTENRVYLYTHCTPPPIKKKVK